MLSATTPERLPLPALLIIAIAVCAAITGEVLPVGLLPSIARGLSVSQSGAGLLVSTYSVVVTLGAIPIAALLDRWPRRRVLCALLIAYGITTLGFAASSDYWTALVTRGLGGAVHAAFFSIAFAASAEIAPTGRTARALALVSLGNTAGLALGVPLATQLGLTVGWRPPFLILGLLQLVLAPLVAAVLPLRRARSTATEHTGASAPTARGLGLVALLVIVLMLGHYMPYTYLASLIAAGGAGTASTGPVLLAYGVAAASGALVVARLPDAATVRGVGLATALLVVALLALAVSPRASVPAICAWGVAFGALVPLLQTSALRAAPHLGSRAPAVVNAAFNAAITGGALIGGAALLLGSPSWLAAGGAVLAAASTGLLIPVARATRRDGAA